MNYTPRQLQAFLFLAAKRRQGERRDQVQDDLVAARGDERQVLSLLKDLEN